MSTQLYDIEELPDGLRAVHRTVSSWRFVEALVKLSRISWSHPPGQPGQAPPPLQHLRKWHADKIAYLAKVIILRCDLHRGKVPSDGDMLDALQAIHQSSEPVGDKGFNLEAQSDKRIGDIVSVVNRHLAAQLPLRFSDLHQISRAMRMFGVIPQYAGLELRLDWDQQLQALYGFTGRDILAMLFAFYVKYQGGIVTRGNLTQYFAVGPYNKSQIDQFFNTFSGNQTDFIELAQSRQEVPPELDYYAFNPLYELPMVRVGRARYVIPSRHIFIYALTSGLFWKLRNALARKSSSGKNAADDDLGILLETYVRELAQHYLTPEDFVPEVAYNGKKWADAAIVHGSTGITIECKAHGFGLEALGTGRIASAEKDLEQNLIKGLTQTAKNLREVNDAAKIEPRLAEVTSWLPVIVMYEVPVPLNFPDIRKTVLAKLRPADRELVEDYQALTIEDFECLMMYAKLMHPVETMRQKSKHEPCGSVKNLLIEEFPSAGEQGDRSYFRQALNDASDYISSKFS